MNNQNKFSPYGKAWGISPFFTPTSTHPLTHLPILPRILPILPSLPTISWTPVVNTKEERCVLPHRQAPRGLLALDVLQPESWAPLAASG